MSELQRAKAEAAFWQMKYFELLGHTAQIVGHLGQPMMAQALMSKLQPPQPQSKDEDEQATPAG